jgi:hypothetical protein
MILGPEYTGELDTDFTKQEVRKLVKSMKDNKAAGFSGIPAAVWKMFSTGDKGIDILIDLFNKIKNKKVITPE